jgi:glyoxylase-like metal-dependent hydrolase (beta-lactamase superfamily II)
MIFPDRAAVRPVTRVAQVLVLVTTCAGLAQPLHAQSPDASARSLPAERPELRSETLRPGFHLVADVGANVLVWSGPDGTVLVDTGHANSSQELLDLAGRLGPGPLRFVVNTHGHADHTGGNVAATAGGAVVIGHESLREHAGRDAAVPSGTGEGGAMPTGSRPVLTLVDTLALHLNGDRADVLHVADAHTSADLVVRWARADVVALGDVYWSRQYPSIDLESGGSLAGMVAAVEGTLARTNARSLIVPGHGAPTSRAELAAWRDMLVAVGRKVREGIERGETLQGILDSRPTADFDARYAQAGAMVSAEDFVRTVYTDLTRRR